MSSKNTQYTDTDSRSGFGSDNVSVKLVDLEDQQRFFDELNVSP